MNYLRLLRFAERQAFDTLKIPALRNISHHPFKFTEVQDRWRERDGLSKRWQLIYKGPMDTALNYLTLYLTVSTSTIGLAGIYYAAFVFDKSKINDPVIIGDDVVIANSPVECLVYIGTFVALHIVMKMLLSRYVIRMYQDGDEYIAVFRGTFFNTIQKHKFNLKTFRRLKASSLISWNDARYDLGSKHGIILENYFKAPGYFNYLLSKKSADNPHKDED